MQPIIYILLGAALAWFFSIFGASLYHKGSANASPSLTPPRWDIGRMLGRSRTNNSRNGEADRAELPVI